LIIDSQKSQTRKEKGESITEKNEEEKGEDDLLKRKEAEEKTRRRTRGPYRKSSSSQVPGLS